MNEKTLSIVIPCYNEENSILDLVKKVLESPVPNKEIIVVDDCSKDGTRTVLERDVKPLVSKIVYHEVNQGKGGALKTGFAAATDVWAKVDIDFLGKRNIEVPEDFIRKIKTHNFATGSKYVIERFNLDEKPEDIAKEWFDMAVQAYADDIDLKPGAADFLENLRQKGYKICIATASDRELYEACLKRNKIFDYFDNFTQSDEVERGKGFPDVYELAAKKCGFGADECVVFEDVYEAVCGAVNGDFYTVAVKDDASNGDIEKIKEKCNLFINDYYDLL